MRQKKVLSLRVLGRSSRSLVLGGGKETPEVNDLVRVSELSRNVLSDEQPEMEKSWDILIPKSSFNIYYRIYGNPMLIQPVTCGNVYLFS